MIASLFFSLALIGTDKMANKLSPGDVTKQAVIKEFLSEVQTAPADATNVVVRIKVDKIDKVQEIPIPAATNPPPRWTRETALSFVSVLDKNVADGTKFQFTFQTVSGSNKTSAFQISAGNLSPIDPKDLTK